MIRRCADDDFETLWRIINDAARIYKGIIPPDRWKEPYMPRDELQQEIEAGVAFWGCVLQNELVGVMGIQPVQDVALIRHSYVRSDQQGRGIGGQLLSFLLQRTDRPVLVGTWVDATWAVRFYEKRGFRLIRGKEKDRLLKKYWSIPERQVETSVVLADQTWFERDAAER